MPDLLWHNWCQTQVLNDNQENISALYLKVSWQPYKQFGIFKKCMSIRNETLFFKLINIYPSSILCHLFLEFMSMALKGNYKNSLDLHPKFCIDFLCPILWLLIVSLSCLEICRNFEELVLIILYFYRSLVL